MIFTRSFEGCKKKKRERAELRNKNDQRFLLFPRKVVVLEKKDEEAFGFEIQVRGLLTVYGRGGS